MNLFRAPALQWSALAALTALFVWILEQIRLPAAFLLGAMAGGIVMAVLKSRVSLPRWSFLIAQGFIGCLMARSIGSDILKAMLVQWPLFFFSITAVILFSIVLGGLLTHWKILPGTTAIWGSAPGGATTMVLMAEAFGADMRLVAFMQFLRVVIVALIASAVARFWVSPHGASVPTIDWFPSVDPLSFAGTLALAIGGAWIGTLIRLPAGALLVPLFAGVLLSTNGLLSITLPPWIMAVCYVDIGCSIGLRFTQEIVRYAARLFPRVLASTLVLIALCGGLAYALHLTVGTDALTAYLATSPGGADSVAIIAASAKVDLPFVMAMQTCRFVLVMLLGPTLARVLASWMDKRSAQAAS